MTLVILAILISLSLGFRESTQLSIQRNVRLTSITTRFYSEDVDDGAPTSIWINGSVETSEYTLSIQIGTPAQDFEVQIDTGSTDLLIYGEDCVGCPQDTPYRPEKSNTSSFIPCKGSAFPCPKCYNPKYCGFDDAYGDGSEVSGYVVSDFLQIGTQEAVVTFGAIRNSSANFEPTAVEGIFGLGNPSLSAWGAQSPLTYFLRQNNYYPAFSLCLQRQGGFLSLGRNDHNTSNIAFWSKVSSANYWAVRLAGMSVGNTALKSGVNKINGLFGALIDSGTTLTLFPSDVFSEISSLWIKQCTAAGLPGCAKLMDGSCYSGLNVNSYPDRKSVV